MHDTPTSGPQSVRQMFDSSLCKMRYDLGENHAPWSVAYFGGIKLHGIDVYQDEGIGFRRALRNPFDIAENPADEFLLAMPFSAQIDLAQNGRLAHCAPGAAILFSTAKPFSSHIAAHQRHGRYSQYLAKVSGPLLRQRIPDIDALGNTPFDVRSGPGKIVKTLFDLALQEGHGLSHAQSRTFSAMLIDAVANVALGIAESSHVQPGANASSPERVRQSATSFIERNLSNPRLDVALVAQHCAVSERYLHLAFAAANTKVGNLIREMRLQHCRSALRNKAMGDKSVTQIALQWGFEDPAHFSRAYKARFGIAPSKERSAADQD